MSSFNPYVEDHTDAFDPGPAFEHGPGMMGPPLRPTDFDAQAIRGVTPPTPSHSPPIHPRIDGPPHITEPFSNDLYDEFAHDHAGPASPRSSAFDPGPSYAARSPSAGGGHEGAEFSAAERRSGEPFGLDQVREGSVFHRAFVREGFAGDYFPAGEGGTVAPGDLALEGEEEEGRRERDGSAGGYGSGWSGH
ncbi:hypothetical protein LTR82_011122 [Friedmanniomyces endolithicus]|uniref:Uncharacterized protein n=1 Tax=Friedmanniomyces endolithicus TaxID=329885 RepID=A0AAN6JAZ4_9PEZI|nr:hypothetical protein LTR82_011122 [Friedmanniomyces endolithicus]